MLHQWCFINDVSWCSPIFPLKKCYKLVGRRTRFALGVVWESMHLSDGTFAKSCSTRWNWSAIKMANWMANMNVKNMGCSCFPYSFPSYFDKPWEMYSGKSSFPYSFPMQTSWNLARMTELFVVNGSFVVRIILKLVKRLFELKLWPISLTFRVQPVSAHFRLCGISASMFFEDWFLSVFPWVFPWIFDQPTHPKGRTLCIGNSELCGSSLWAGLANEMAILINETMRRKNHEK